MQFVKAEAEIDIRGFLQWPRQDVPPNVLIFKFQLEGQRQKTESTQEAGCLQAGEEIMIEKGNQKAGRATGA